MPFLLRSHGPRRKPLAFLVTLTLLTSALHFLDNALRLDLYPGPVWLTRDAILLTWPAVLLLGLAALYTRSRTGLVLYALLGFDGFAHLLMRSVHSLSLRCLFTISAEALASLLLISYVLTHSLREHATS